MSVDGKQEQTKILYDNVVELLAERELLRKGTRSIVLVSELNRHNRLIEKNRNGLMTAATILYRAFHTYTKANHNLYKDFYLQTSATVVKVALKPEKGALLLRLQYTNDEWQDYFMVLIPKLWANDEESFTNVRKHYIESYIKITNEYHSEVDLCKQKCSEEIKGHFNKLRSSTETLKSAINISMLMKDKVE